MRRPILLAAIAFFVFFSAESNAQHSTACADLAKLKLADTRILMAEQYAAGAFPTAPTDPPELVQYAKFRPALCRIVAELTPSPDSSIKVEVWMPAEHWNGKFRGQGNGGFAGEISYQLMGLAVLNGYATAGTDTGHSANFADAGWAKGHPEKIADFGYRAIHLMTQRSKEIIAAYYGTAVKKSYFAACSDGGREALMEAQRFPADYDGILAGAPAYKWTALVTNSLHNAQVQIATPESYIPSSKLFAISTAVLSACGTNAEKNHFGFLDDPSACHFHPAALLCKEGSADPNSCLTAAQVKTLGELYAGAKSRDGKPIFPGYEVGGEADEGGWSQWITGPAAGQSLAFAFANAYFKDMVFADDGKTGTPAWDLRTASLDDAYRAANAKTAGDLNATDANLAPFIADGGKLILYHGWSDPAISPLSTIEYYNRVLSTLGKQATEASIRLYMAPGMGHCTGGQGPDSFGQFGWLPFNGPDDPKRDAYLALEDWVEKGIAPAEIVAHGSKTSKQPASSRPLCPYPLVAKYKGPGELEEAANYACVSGANQ